MRRVIREQEELLQHYAETGNAKLRPPLIHQTMLHLAVKYRKEALVRELLQQGADPNATVPAHHGQPAHPVSAHLPSIAPAAL